MQVPAPARGAGGRVRRQPRGAARLRRLAGVPGRAAPARPPGARPRGRPPRLEARIVCREARVRGEQLSKAVTPPCAAQSPYFVVRTLKLKKACSLLE